MGEVKSAVTRSHIKVQPLSGALGAEISGVDLSKPLTDEPTLVIEVDADGKATVDGEKVSEKDLKQLLTEFSKANDAKLFGVPHGGTWSPEKRIIE